MRLTVVTFASKIVKFSFASVHYTGCWTWRTGKRWTNSRVGKTWPERKRREWMDAFISLLLDRSFSNTPFSIARAASINIFGSYRTHSLDGKADTVIAYHERSLLYYWTLKTSANRPHRFQFQVVIEQTNVSVIIRTYFNGAVQPKCWVTGTNR